MPKKFGKVVLASSGDHPSTKDKQIKNWVEHAGGKFVKDISIDVTHLVCSVKAWKQYTPMIKEARRMRTIHIIKLNWLEDSLLSKSGKPLDTTSYAWEQRKVTKCGVKKRKRDDAECTFVEHGASDDEKATDHSARQSKKRKRSDTDIAMPDKDKRIRAAGKEFDEACVEFEKYMGEKGYRPFTDQSGFLYLLTLVRKDILKNRLEKFRIKVRYAPSFSAEHSTFIPIAHQGVDPRRKKSDSSTFGMGGSTRIGDDNRHFPFQCPILPTCPVPLYYFPENYPYSRNPCIASSLPRHLTSANPNLRVRIPDPWAQSLQLFVSDALVDTKVSGNPGHPTTNVFQPPDLPQLRTRSYAAYVIYAKLGARHVQTLVPLGSSFDFAWSMFTKFFAKKTGSEWADVHNGWKKGIKVEEIIKQRFGGEDGADDNQRWDMLEPPMTIRCVAGAEKGSAEFKDARERMPSVTVVMNTTEVMAADDVAARAKTPENGW